MINFYVGSKLKTFQKPHRPSYVGSKLKTFQKSAMTLGQLQLQLWLYFLLFYLLLVITFLFFYNIKY